MAKVKYELDPHNRLIASGGLKGPGVFKYRRVTEGRLTVGGNNDLIYHVKSPVDGDGTESGLPHQVKFRGRWSLSQGDKLVYTLTKWRRASLGDELTLKGQFVKADSGSLTFACSGRDADGKKRVHSICLSGYWSAGRDNRLIFRVKRGSNTYDRLNFGLAWDIGKEHRLRYAFRERNSSGARKNAISFDGKWRLLRKRYLTYSLDAADDSRFDFRIGSALAEKRKIRFEVGIGARASGRCIERSLVFYGRWKLQRGAGLRFEAETGAGRRCDFRFEARLRERKGRIYEIDLFNTRGRDLGISFTLSKSVFEGMGKAFMKAVISRKEKGLYIGSGFAW